MTKVTLFTGGDRPYVLGLAPVLNERGVSIDLIGGDNIESPEWQERHDVCFLNLRGDQRTEANFIVKMFRVLRYYARLLRYAWMARTNIFHILWNEKFEWFDRTLLMLYYKALGKRVILTAHNINKRKRDAKDSVFNRLSLKVQYRLCDHIFVHTEQMKTELIQDFDGRPSSITVIPFGINNAVPNTQLSSSEAKARLGIMEEERTILFFGRITPYKGLEYLVEAFLQLLIQPTRYRLVIAGRPDNDSEGYFQSIQEQILRQGIGEQVLLRIEFVPDSETELYFKAADVLVLPYRQIYQSGVLFLAYSFGLPVIATNVGGLPDEIVEGETGYLCQPENPEHLAMAIERYFKSQLFCNLGARREEIRAYARQRYSWDRVAQMTVDVYANLNAEHVSA